MLTTRFSFILLFGFVLVQTAASQLLQECGLPKAGARTRTFHPETNIAIVGGKEASVGDFPWHASIYYFHQPSRTYQLICGGTLVTSNIIVSAAHCFKSESDRILIDNVPMDQIRIGLGHIQREFDSPLDTQRQIFKVSRIVVHPDYTASKDNYGDDIALVYLDRPTTYTNAVRPACLDIGPNNKEHEQLSPGYSGKVAGWGLTENGTASDTLMGANVPYIARNECLQNTENFFNYITKDKLCGGNYTSVWATVCQGDSGGGLVSFEKNTIKYYLRGIVSLGGTVCTDGDYTLFTHIAKQTAFLQQYIALPDKSSSRNGQVADDPNRYRNVRGDNGYRYRDLNEKGYRDVANDHNKAVEKQHQFPRPGHSHTDDSWRDVHPAEDHSSTFHDFQTYMGFSYNGKGHRDAPNNNPSFYKDQGRICWCHNAWSPFL